MWINFYIIINVEILIYVNAVKYICEIYINTYFNYQSMKFLNENSLIPKSGLYLKLYR